MTGHSMKQFRLAATLLVAIGLGFTRILPVQASAIADFADSSNLEKNYQFKLEDPTLAPSQSVKNKPPASVTQVGTGSAIGNFPTKTEPSAAKTSQAHRSQKKSGDDDDNRFFFIVWIAFIAAIFYNFLTRGAHPAAAEKPTPPKDGEANSEAKNSTTLSSSKVDNEAEPVAVPTPALLPGLLGMGLKLMRDKKVHSQTASGLEVP